MKKPLIGLTTSLIPNPYRNPAFSVNEPYAEAITHADGLPVLIPMSLSKDDLLELIHQLDGILFTGGGDIDPSEYGGLPHPKLSEIDHHRDQFESYLVQIMIRSGKPFLGICRGLQVINVALGGSLYEHLPDQLPGNVIHDNHHKPRNYLSHSVRVVKDSLIGRIMLGSVVKVNSLHHQGIHRLSDQLLPTAQAEDGLVEAVELPGYTFGLAVQWHPEELLELETMRGLFQALVDSCRVN
jgi:putative glutamine amidotransferase